MQFTNNDLVELDAVNTLYHVGCDGHFIEPTSGFKTYGEMCEEYGLLSVNHKH